MSNLACEWDFEDRDGEVAIIIPNPDNEDPGTFKIGLTTEEISITANNRLIVCGHLGHKVDSAHRREVDNQNIIFILKKADPQIRWTAIVDGPDSQNRIDGQTAYIIAGAMKFMGDDKQARDYTARAVAEGFPVAVKAEVRAHKADAQRNENIKHVLSELADRGDREAIVLRSELFIDANQIDRAQVLLERVPDDPTACQLLAKLALRRRNMDEAARYYIRARNGAERIEEIEQYIVERMQQSEVDDSSWYAKAILVAAGMGGAVGLAFGLIYSTFFRNKK